MKNFPEFWINTRFSNGDKATCRTCGLEIFFVQVGERTNFGYWTLVPGEQPKQQWADVVEETDCKHRPKEFCSTSPDNSTGICARPVKYEDMVAEIYACGHHRKRAVQQKEEQERILKRKIREEQGRKIKEFEFEQYRHAATWLRENGYESLVEGYRLGSGWINRKISVDVHKLYEILSGKDVGDGEVRGKQADPWSIDDSEVQV